LKLFKLLLSLIVVLGLLVVLTGCPKIADKAVPVEPKEMYGIIGGESNIMRGSVLSVWHDCREQTGKSCQCRNPRELKNGQTMTAEK